MNQRQARKLNGMVMHVEFGSAKTTVHIFKRKRSRSNEVQSVLTSMGWEDDFNSENYESEPTVEFSFGREQEVQLRELIKGLIERVTMKDF